MSGFVYIWINKVNNKKYIGSHIGTVDDGYIGSGVIFKQAVAKYGIDNFERVILEHVDLNENVRDREQHYLDLFNAANDRSFYNVKAKAGGGFELINDDPVRKQQCNEINREKALKRFAEGKHPRGMAGKHHTEETKQKKREISNVTTRHLWRPVLQYDLEGNLVAKHESITHGARAVRGQPSNIKYAIEGKFQTAYKHVWKYDS